METKEEDIAVSSIWIYSQHRAELPKRSMNVFLQSAKSCTKDELEDSALCLPECILQLMALILGDNEGKYR